MGHHSQARTPKRVKREYRKAFRERGKSNKRSNRYGTKQEWREKMAPSQQQIFEITLKRLHTLGSQKFGSSPFREHFNRWLLTVETVLDEFEAKPEIDIDKQFTEERTQILTTVKLQLEKHRQVEESIERQINSLTNAKNRLQQTHKEYLTKALELRGKKNVALKRLNRELEILKMKQDQIVKLKTGFFRGLSRKEREEKENIAVQHYMEKQQEFEITTLYFKEKQKQLKEEFESEQDPWFEKVKSFQKFTKEIDEDKSLEDRWFACETLRDIINNFFQRKTNTPVETTKKP
jgi:hypothetical protein